MKRSLGLGFVGLLAVSAAGCPIYSHDGYCYDSQDCRKGEYCTSDGYCAVVPGGSGGSGGGYGGAGGGGGTQPKACASPSECGPNQTCAANGKCLPGDCSFNGCVSGFQCQVADGTYKCLPGALPDGGAGAAGTASDGGDGGPGGTQAGDGASGAGGAAGAAGSDGGVADAGPAWCGHPADCLATETCAFDGVCKSGDCGATPCINGFVCKPAGGDALSCQYGNPKACGADAQCASFGNGWMCVDGLCTAPSDLCTDGTQCAAGNVCVDGKCTPKCTTDAECGKGYGCNSKLGACLTPKQPCQKSSECGSASSVCVDHACVPRCGSGGTCPSGAVCVDNGCVPVEKIAAQCNGDGVKDACPVGSICLYHGCYVDCGGAPGACTTQAPYTVCKTVTTASGPHPVCGSNKNLGGECNAVTSNLCPLGKVCIDGFCLAP